MEMAAGQLDSVDDEDDTVGKETGKLTMSLSEIMLVFSVESSKNLKALNFLSSLGLQDQFFSSSTVWRLRSSITSCTRRSEVAVSSCGEGWLKKSSRFVWSITLVILFCVSEVLEDGLG